MFTLPDLPYSPDALEPHIDAQTMQLHHDKHHAAYVNNLNNALSGQEELLNLDVETLLQSLDQVPADVKQTVINNAGGHANHSFFWQIMGPAAQSGAPTDVLASALNSTFGSLEKFQEAFTAKAMSVFGSGWAFLVKQPDGSLSLKRHSFQNSPLMQGNLPLLGVDVWEHAYYLKYQNRRAEYLAAWWQVINWTKVSELFNQAS